MILEIIVIAVAVAHLAVAIYGVYLAKAGK
jgi:hypothetical protein